MTFIHRRINVDATSRRCIDVVSTLRVRWVVSCVQNGMFSTHSQEKSLFSPSMAYKMEAILRGNNLLLEGANSVLQ